jgi:hypothetical protein
MNLIEVLQPRRGMLWSVPPSANLPFRPFPGCRALKLGDISVGAFAEG